MFFIERLLKVAIKKPRIDEIKELLNQDDLLDAGGLQPHRGHAGGVPAASQSALARPHERVERRRHRRRSRRVRLPPPGDLPLPGIGPAARTGTRSGVADLDVSQSRLGGDGDAGRLGVGLARGQTRVDVAHAAVAVQEDRGSPGHAHVDVAQAALGDEVSPAYRADTYFSDGNIFEYVKIYINYKYYSLTIKD